MFHLSKRFMIIHKTIVSVVMILINLLTTFAVVAVSRYFLRIKIGRASCRERV